LPGGDALKAGRLAKKVIQEAAGEGAEQVAKQETKNALQEQGKKQISQNQSSQRKQKCSSPPKSPKRYTPYARERMRQRDIPEEKVEEIMRNDKSPRRQPNGRFRYTDGKFVVVVEPDGTVVTVYRK
jgi:hypothetical protein